MNYSKVFEFLFQKGRAVWVTILLVTLVILGALTVNPLAAYALSRGRQSNSSKFLIFFLATMAFPAEVAMIPGFLLLRDLNMLNTFAALVLPGLANGYSIFLLKGFFDSVPRELFEAADIDGANELQKFWSITFPMSKPILAVIALNAFKMAYGGFMWAFLTCQDPKMWTIMVWLYDFQGRYGAKPGMCMAAFVLASIPTLLVFLFCQKIIMRGIVIPTVK
ncbi:MAG: carbohydrate ABC transporter permease [Kiritimatiellaeota bacterium]|nr:carbohydrate ABC transporter permease [Kiritimatiellota bacterium]